MLIIHLIITAKRVLRFLENGKALVWAFTMQLKPRDGEIRFPSASNAFSSCTEIEGGNGCRPSFSEFPHPSVAKSEGYKS